MKIYEAAKIRAEIIKAMAHPARLMIIEFLANDDKLFSEIYTLFNCDKSTISKHLLVLKNAGIVSSQKKGLDVLYKLETKCIIKFLNCINNVINKSIKRKKECLKCK